jgi:hypothetical protein
VTSRTNREDEGLELWQRTVAALLDEGYSPSEAIDGGNLILEAYKRQHAQNETGGDSMMKSGLRRRPQK